MKRVRTRSGVDSFFLIKFQKNGATFASAFEGITKNRSFS